MENLDTAVLNIIEKKETQNDTGASIEQDGFVSLKPQRETCEVCFLNEYKYKCPGCLMKTCSLKCCNEHKALKSCDGKYHHEKYIPLNSMSQKTMKKDLDYLNEMMHGSDKVKKKLSLLKKNQEQLRFKLLKIYARKLHNIKVRLAPSIMSRHRENLSFYHTKSKRIYWTLELKFCSFMKRNIATGEIEPIHEEIRILLDPQDENVTLFETIRNLKLDDPQILWYLQEKFEDSRLLENISCSRLYAYICDEQNPRERLARRLDWFVAFKDCLKDITVIEYPSLRIVSYKEFDEFEKLYKIVDPVLQVTPAQ